MSVTTALVDRAQTDPGFRWAFYPVWSLSPWGKVDGAWSKLITTQWSWIVEIYRKSPCVFLEWCLMNYAQGQLHFWKSPPVVPLFPVKGCCSTPCPLRSRVKPFQFHYGEVTPSGITLTRKSQYSDELSYLLEALCYKPEGSGLDSRWGH
jgi:hypothetical protein